MERQEYPAMLDSLQPMQAVEVLNNRVQHGGRLNIEIAEWLEERRRIEETYAQSMRKLARKQPPGPSSDLGVFLSPWKKIAASAEAIGDSHYILAQKIEADVERPLRNFAQSNREMQAMSTIQGNLASLARNVDSAQRKAGKARDASSVDDAYAQWSSQAPYVFEALQAADESRCNHLRDVLTQLETHEADLIQRNRVTAESCLNALLSIDTADEIKTFAVRHTGSGGIQRPGPSRQQTIQPDRSSSRAPPSRTPSQNMLQSMPSPAVDDDRGDHEEKHEKKSRLSGIKRLGTVIARRRQSTQPLQSGSPATKPRDTFTPDSMNRSLASRDTFPQDSLTKPPPSRDTFSRGTLSRDQSESDIGPSRLRSASPPSGAGQLVEEPDEIYAPPRGPPPGRSDVNYGVNGGNSPLPSPPSTNGTRTNPFGQLQEPLQPQSAQSVQQAARDAEGFSVRPPANDPISQAEEDADELGETPAQQFNLNIRNAPMADSNADAEAAMANMAETLRAATPARRQQSVRGRRDVRNTVFLDSSSVPQMPDSYLSQSTSSIPPVPALPTYSGLAPPATSPMPPSTSSGIIMTPFLASIADSQNPQPEPPAITSNSAVGPPQQQSQNNTNTTNDIFGAPNASASDTTGLTTSIVETISCHIEKGNVTRPTVIGELALRHDAGAFPSASTTESIRLENFHVLEKVAANPTFVQQIGGKPGTYTVNLASITGQLATAFKYQLHIDEASAASYAPLTLTPSWRVEEGQTSVILAYSLNQAFQLRGTQSVTLSNVVLAISLGEGAGTAATCLSKPTGTFSKERNLIYWRLGEITLRPGAPLERVLARFTTEGQAVPGKVEARWEINNPQAGLGSGLNVSVAESSSAGAADPFADEDDLYSAGDSGKSWKEIEGTKRLVSGSYTAA